MAVIEIDLNRIAADRDQFIDSDILLAHLQYLLARPVTGNLGGWRIHPQQLIGERVAGAILKSDFEHARLLVQLYFRRLV